MSGKRHHFIPRFLQKGFISHSNGNEHYTWVFRKDSDPFNTNLINVGLEKHFYTIDEDDGLDRTITEAEVKYSELVDRLRKMPFGEIKDELIPEFIAHLEIRTSHLRTNFLLLSGMLLDHLTRYLSDNNNMYKLAVSFIRDPSSDVHKLFVDILVNTGDSEEFVKKKIEEDPEMILLFLMIYLPSSDELKASIKASLTFDNLSNEIKKGHINALKQSISPEIKRDIFKKLSFSVEEFKNGNLILGDSGILFKLKNEYTTLVHKHAEIEAVYLPLAADRYLVGKVQDFDHANPELIEIIARNSMDYFISPDNSEDLGRLHQAIGEEALILPESEVEEIVENISV